MERGTIEADALNKSRFSIVICEKIDQDHDKSSIRVKCLEGSRNKKEKMKCS